MKTFKKLTESFEDIWYQNIEHQLDEATDTTPEELEEVSTDLLDRYKKKAGESARAADKQGDFSLGHKRFKGIMKATKKQFANDEKKTRTTSEASIVWPGTPEYKEKYGSSSGATDSSSPLQRGSRHDIVRDPKKGVTKATRQYDKSSGESKDERPEVVLAPKRGRGRPPGAYGTYKRKVKESINYIKNLEEDKDIKLFVDSLSEEEVIDLSEYFLSLDEVLKNVDVPEDLPRDMSSDSFINDLKAHYKKLSVAFDHAKCTTTMDHLKRLNGVKKATAYIEKEVLGKNKDTDSLAPAPVKIPEGLEVEAIVRAVGKTKGVF